VVWVRGGGGGWWTTGVDAFRNIHSITSRY
jgi:hypothetical protein